MASHEAGHQRRHLPVNPAQQSAEAAEHHQGTDDASAEGEAALPCAAVVKASQVGQGDGQQRQRAGAKAREGASGKHQPQRERPGLAKALLNSASLRWARSESSSRSTVPVVLMSHPPVPAIDSFDP